MSEDLQQQAEELIVLLRRFRLGVYAWVNRDLAKRGSNLPQYTVLSLLDEMGETSMGPLAEELGTTMGAATNLVDKLVFAELVKRGRDEKDRRIVKVKLTPQGREVLKEITARGASFLAEVLGELSPEERRTYIALERKLGELARKVTGHNGGGALADPT